MTRTRVNPRHFVDGQTIVDVVVDQKQEHVADAGVKVVTSNGLSVMVAQSRTPGTFHRVSPVPLPAIFITAARSS